MEQIGASITIALVGLGVVFVFLGLLVAVISAIGALAEKYFPEPPAAAPPKSEDDGSEIAAAISAAVAAYLVRRKQSKEESKK